MENDFNRWLEYAQWRGQTVQALKDITNELKELKNSVEKTKELLQQDISNIRTENRRRDIRSAEIAGGTSVLIIMLGWLISNILATV